MLKGIIFDMDGVLINSEPLHFRVWKEALKMRGVELDYEIYKPCIGSTIGFLMDILHDNYGIDRQDEELIRTMKKIKEETVKREGFPLIDGVPELLERLKKRGYKMAIASSSPQKYIEQVTETLKIRKNFDLLVSGESVENPKPAPDIFLTAASKMQLKPEECLVVEDSGNGCKAAFAAGITCMAYYNPDSGKQDLGTATMIVEGYEEIDGMFVEKIYCHSRHLPAPVCETDRMFIREMEEKDIPRMMELSYQNSTAGEVEGTEKTLEEEIAGFPAYRKYMYEMCDMGYWALVEKDTGEIIGRAGVEPKIWNHGNSVIELGYLIDEKYRGMGYAYEACRAILKEVEKRGARYLYCRIRKRNIPSRHLAEKLGFCITDYSIEGEGDDMLVYQYICG